MRHISKQHKKIISETVKRMHQEGKYPEPWNKGKNKFDDPRVATKKTTGRYKECIICFKKYWTIPSQDNRRKFCSYKCYNEYVSEYRTGSKSPAWRGGKTKENILRTTRHYKVWRKGVFVRDNFTCKMCGVVGGSLEAHHILPRRTHPRLWKSVKNGITLCVNCHHSIKNRELEYADQFIRWTCGRGGEK